MGFLAIVAPVGGMLGIAVTGLVLATFGQLAVMAAAHGATKALPVRQDDVPKVYARYREAAKAFKGS